MESKIITNPLTKTLLKGCFLLLFTFFPTAIKSQVTISVSNQSVKKILGVIESKSEYRFFYSEDLNELNEIRSLNVSNSTIDKTLSLLFEKTNIGYKFEKKNLIVLFLKPIKNTQNSLKKISGQVTDSKGDPIIGATLKVVGSNTGSITDINGHFSLEVTTASKLSISYIGFKPEFITILDKTYLQISLQEDSKNLDEVVVVGYGTQKKATLTGAIAAVNSREIVTTKNENILNMLTGKVAGLRVVQNTGEPGDFNNYMDIRGLGTPLIIIDGVPSSTMSRIDPNDIESVSVLKDASAAVYGVRAANGVILITTKKGSNEKLELNYTSNYGWQMPSGLSKTVGAIDYMTLSNEKSMHNVNGGSLRYSDADLDQYRNGILQSTDWYSAVVRQFSPTTQHNISATGGNEKTNFFISLGYAYQSGIERSNDLNYNKYNFRSNVSSKITERLKVNFNISGIMDQKDRAYAGDSWNIFKSIYRQTPIDPLYANNNPDYLINPRLDSSNPIAMMDADLTGYVKNNNKWIETSASLTYDLPLVKGLQAMGLFSYNYNVSDNKSFKKQYNLFTYDSSTDIYTPYLLQTPASISRAFYSKNLALYQLSLNYNRTFEAKHNISALLLFEQSVRSGDNFNAFRELSIPIDQLMSGNSLNQVASMSSSGNDLYKDANQGIVGRINYTYLTKYIAEVSFRYDGSSKFPSNSRWALFPSISGGWRISEEEFWKTSKLAFINNVKLRASYGIMGDDASSRYQFLTGYNYPAWGVNNRLPAGSIFNGVFINSIESAGIANPNITWYTAKTLNTGLDIEVWNGLLGITFDLFQRNRSGLLTSRINSLPDVVGATLPQENLNSDLTRGFELELSHRNKINKFSYLIKGNLSFARSQNDYQENARQGNSYLNWRNNTSNRWSNIWWGYGTDGQYQSTNEVETSPIHVWNLSLPGDYKYQDWNGDGMITDLDVHPITYTTSDMPIINFGLTLGMSYEGFDCNMLFQGSALRYIAYDEMLRYPLWANSSSLIQFMDRWHPVDPKADPYDPNTEWASGNYAYTGTISEMNSRFNMQNASYIRLKTIEIGYTVPTKITTKMGIKGIRIYANGYNLLTLSAMKYIDPEHSSNDYGYSYPLTKTFSMGLNVKF